MYISNHELTNLAHGFIHSVENEEGYMIYYRCTKEQIKYLKSKNDFLYSRALFQSSITIEFITTAAYFKFDYKIFNVGSLDSFDIYINKNLYKCISLSDDLLESTIEVELPIGNKLVTIYLPCDSQTGIKNFYIDGNCNNNLEKNELVLCYGDSITQGFGSLKSSITYINYVAREFNWDVINQGIGGYLFDENYITLLEDKKPNKIIVSFGTNQLESNEKYQEIDKFFLKLKDIYKDITILVVSPIWRIDEEGLIDLIEDMYKYLKNFTSLEEEYFGKEEHQKIVNIVK